MSVDEWGISNTVEPEQVKKKEKKKKVSVWDTMNSSVDRTKPFASLDAIEAISPFMFARLLSNNIMSVFWADELNTHINIPKEWQYKFVRISFPKDKLKYIRYPKNDEKYTKEVVQYATTEYKCGIEIAIKYLDMLPQNRLDDLIEKYNIDSKVKK